MIRLLPSRLPRPLRWLCRATGMLLLLTLVLLVILNLAIKPYTFIAGILRKPPGKDQARSHAPATLAKVYPEKSDAEIAAILHDTRECRPTGPKIITPPPFTSTHVNISPEGYRPIKGQMPFSTNPDHCNVFVFGGSTTWGYGLPDGETIASHLQRHLNDGLTAPRYRVVNYGVCASYSKYERKHLERLIQEEKQPDHVVFIDGLNEFCRIPLNRPREDAPDGIMIPPLIFNWVIRPTLFWRDQLAGNRSPIKDAVVAYDDTDLERARAEFLSNWKMIEALCRERNIGCTLVLQPVPVYGYPLDEDLFLSEEDLLGERSYYLAARKGYGMLFEKNSLLDLDVLDLHQLRCSGHEYLDTCHYTSAFASEIARAIADRSIAP
jgi:lysophospholipase L1-like esterase